MADSVVGAVICIIIIWFMLMAYKQHNIKHNNKHNKHNQQEHYADYLSRYRRPLWGYCAVC